MQCQQCLQQHLLFYYIFMGESILEVNTYLSMKRLLVMCQLHSALIYTLTFSCQKTCLHLDWLSVCNAISIDVTVDQINP